MCSVSSRYNGFSIASDLQKKVQMTKFKCKMSLGTGIKGPGRDFIVEIIDVWIDTEGGVLPGELTIGGNHCGVGIQTELVIRINIGT